MLGLFEGDTNFLDELAGQDLGSSSMLGVNNTAPMGSIGQHSMMSQGAPQQGRQFVFSIFKTNLIGIC